MRKQHDVQKLIDICFEVAILSARYNSEKSNEEIADWVRGNLNQCGFKVSDPVGLSWGILKE